MIENVQRRATKLDSVLRNLSYSEGLKRLGLPILEYRRERADLVRGMAGKFVDTISIFNRKRNLVKMNISGFAKIFHEQIDEIL